MIMTVVRMDAGVVPMCPDWRQIGETSGMDLVERSGWARRWLFDSALPLWLERGSDPRHGGWFDKLDQAGNALPGPKRLRVQARQVFVFAEAGRLGWAGDWRRGVQTGLDFILAHYRRDDGFFRAAVDVTGAPLSDAVDIYDQAFVIFALAAGYGVLDRPQALRGEAQALLANLHARLAHPLAGFEEADPRLLPLRSNPHMHLLEAMLAWLELGVHGLFDETARAIVDLALRRLIDPATGAIGEFYDGDWQFAEHEGHLREPGHQFEWAYLLDACARQLGGDHAMAVRRLAAFGNAFGVRQGRTIFSVDAAGQLIDGRARLWATTERLRTMTVLGTAEDGPFGADERVLALRAAEQSAQVLESFMAVPVAGLWSDWIDQDGNLLVEPVPASSLYHIVTGLVPVIERGGVIAMANDI
jgi:mannose-6-phosphate isomerase